MVFSDAEIRASTDKWRNALVGKFLDQDFPLKFVEKKMRELVGILMLPFMCLPYLMDCYCFYDRLRKPRLRFRRKDSSLWLGSYWLDSLAP